MLVLSVILNIVLISRDKTKELKEIKDKYINDVKDVRSKITMKEDVRNVKNVHGDITIYGNVYGTVQNTHGKINIEEKRR